MAYSTIYTSYGRARLIAAQASGVPINLTHMAVGDGGGDEYTPLEGMTALINERYRTTINRVQPDPANPLQFYVEMVIPYNVGGWTIREFGIFDDQGRLFAIGNYPSTYKTVPAEGATVDMVIRAEVIVANAALITVQVDPNVAVASQSWVLATITPALLLPGGLTNQVLRKKSNIDGDVEWSDPSFSNITVNVVEDYGTLSEGQQVITLINTNTTGLAIYIEGVRIRQEAGPGGWIPYAGGNPETQVLLGKQYPAGTRWIAVQNEPAAFVPVPLSRSQNLADLENKATARTNLDVYSKAEVDQKMPPGLVAYFARNTAPVGWLKCNGAAVSRTAYAALFASIGTTFGAGDGSTTFNVPDLRGEFIRGWDDGRGVDTGRGFGSWQDSENKAHQHWGTTHQAGGHSHNATTYSREGPGQPGKFADSGGRPVSYSWTDEQGWHSHDFLTSYVGANESRPRNRALLACIKF